MIAEKDNMFGAQRYKLKLNQVRTSEPSLRFGGSNFKQKFKYFLSHIVSLGAVIKLLAIINNELGSNDY